MGQVKHISMMNVGRLVYHDHGNHHLAGLGQPFPWPVKSWRFPPWTCCLRKPISVSRGWWGKVSKEKSKNVSLKRHEPWEYYGNPEVYSLRVSGQEGRPIPCKSSHIREKARQWGEEGRKRGVKRRSGNLFEEPRNNLGWEALLGQLSPALSWTEIKLLRDLLSPAFSISGDGKSHSHSEQLLLYLTTVMVKKFLALYLTGIFHVPTCDIRGHIPACTFCLRICVIPGSAGTPCLHSLQKQQTPWAEYKLCKKG